MNSYFFRRAAFLALVSQSFKNFFALAFAYFSSLRPIWFSTKIVMMICSGSAKHRIFGSHFRCRYFSGDFRPLALSSPKRFKVLFCSLRRFFSSIKIINPTIFDGLTSPSNCDIIFKKQRPHFARIINVKLIHYPSIRSFFNYIPFI